MTKLVILFEEPTDREGFEEYYMNTHLPLSRHVPYVNKTSVHQVVQVGQLPEHYGIPYKIAELEFENVELLQQALASPEWQNVLADAVHLFAFLPKPPLVVVVDSYT